MSDDGQTYFKRCLGVSSHLPAVYGRHTGTHPTIIRQVYEEALTRFPAAADVIAGMVFKQALDRNREASLRQEKAD